MLIGNIERLRAVPRLVEITRTLIHFGLHDLVHSVGVHRVLEGAGHRLGWAPDPDIAAKSLPERLRLALEALGPAFVKLGQVLAVRLDLLGPEWIAELDRLHDRATPVPFEAFEAQLLRDLGGSVASRFARFDMEAAAAGSIAQVHRARLPGGQEVAVKIRRPGVEAQVEADVLLLEVLAAWWEDQDPTIRRFRPVEIVRLLRKSLAREVDFSAEARAQERFADTFRDDPGIVVPKVYPAFTTPSLLVMDWIDGIPGTDMAALDAAGGFDRQKLAACGADAMMRMVLVDGLFHADPHIGNMFFLPGNRIALIDFGMVGWLSPKRRDEMIDLLAAVAGRDADALRDVLLAWTDGRSVSSERFSEDLGRLLHLYEHATLREINLGALLAEIANIMREHGLVLPPDLALLFKAIITLEGLGMRLVPHFQLVEHVTPRVKELILERWSPRRIAGRAQDQAREWGRAARAAPRFFESLARRFSDDGVALRFEVREIETFSRHLEGSVNRATIGLVTAALMVGSAILLSSPLSEDSLVLRILAGLGILISFGNSVWLIYAIRRSRRD